MASQPKVSVIVPVFNDGDRLVLCLAALAQQTYPRERTEVIVVDNGSEDGEAVRRAIAPYDHVAIAHEPTPGSYAARNRGVALAQGEVLAFTDADCIPAPAWLEQGVAALTAAPEIGQVVGQVEAFFPNPDRPTPVDLFERITAFPQETLLKTHHGGATANVFTWRWMFDRVGLFNARLRSHGDLEWGQRVYAAGYRQVYAAQVVVRHPTRSSVRGLIKRTQRMAGGRYGLDTDAASFWQRQGVFVRSLGQNLVPPVWFTLHALGHRDLQGLGQKLQVALVMVGVRYVTAFELLRLKLGGVPCRE